MKKIAVVTATRAEYGILTPLIRKINNDNDLELELLVTGTHLVEKYGYTKKFIVEDGFVISHEINILEAGNGPREISRTVANAINGFSEIFSKDRPDMLVILGDRTEMLGIAIAAMNERIPIAHIHGGEVTEGAVDDCVRHSLTKMSYLHFSSTEMYRKRIIQLGEAPSRVFNVGALGTENILNEELLTEEEVRFMAGISIDRPYAVVTFHPVTLESDSASEQVQELCNAMLKNSEIFYLITMANADNGGDMVNRMLKEFSEQYPENITLVSSLGMKKYLSAVKYATFVLGNSSSGIIEAPIIGTPTVNIGDRQKGRFMANSIISCEPIEADIDKAIKIAERMPHVNSRIYGYGNTSEKIVDIIKSFLSKDVINLKKSFYDIEVQE